MALVWVYGTLRRGESNHSLMRECAYLGQWWSPPNFYLIDLGEYPGIISGQQSVLGEIYVVDEPTLARLDLLEETPDEYTREMMLTPWGEAFYYHYRQTCQGLAAIPSGDWRCRFVC
ncbi:MAG: gamma-glutamylcyclotransferase family protein [Aeromonadaceae bacterium]